MIYPVRAEVTEEICLSQRQGFGNQYETLPFIPGRILWGTVASLTGIRPREQPDKTFMNIFYSGNVVFSNLYPEDKGGYRTKPAPLSARTFKSAPGFKNDGVDYSQNGYADGVDDWLLRGIPKDILYEDHVKHQGFYSGNPPACNTFHLSFNQLTQHERDNLRGITKAGRLFSRITIPKGTVFIGYIKSNINDLDKTLEDTLKKTGIIDGIEIPIGRSPGRIFLKKEDDIAKVLDENISFYPEYFSISCYSDTIIPDPFHRYLTYVPETIISDIVRDTVEFCKLERFFSSKKVIHGWNGAYQRPLEAEIAISMGSSFLFRFELKSDKNQRDLLAILKNLQAHGLGLRRQEGFGEIRINDPFHFQAGVM